mmetsp:Transcript_11434/g.21613  ORF Transcript_11434/g.21613 Transcript_11434/m.21613 type:complete len:275 (+) Transcript_11434:70-894(+)
MGSLPEACILGDEEQVAWWLEKLQSKYLCRRLQPADRSPLHAAAMHGHADCVALLLESGSFMVGDRDQTGATAMAYACENGHLRVVQLLSSYGAQRSHLRECSYFAFEAAAAHAPVLEWLAKTKDWCSPLHHASLLPSSRVISLLRSGASLHKRKRDPTRTCISPLELAASCEGEASAGCQLVVEASRPWSVRTHHLFPLTARKDAATLIFVGYAVARCQSCQGRQLLDVWRHCIMPLVIERPDRARLQLRPRDRHGQALGCTKWWPESLNFMP